MRQFKQTLMQRCGPLPAPERRLCLKKTFIDALSPTPSDRSERSPRSAPAVLEDTLGQDEWACNEAQYVEELSAKVWEVPLPTIEPLQQVHSLSGGSSRTTNPAEGGRKHHSRDDGSDSDTRNLGVAGSSESASRSGTCELQRKAGQQRKPLSTEDAGLSQGTFIDFRLSVSGDDPRHSPRPDARVAQSHDLLTHEEQPVQVLAERVGGSDSPLSPCSMPATRVAQSHDLFTPEEQCMQELAEKVPAPPNPQGVRRRREAPRSPRPERRRRRPKTVAGHSLVLGWSPCRLQVPALPGLQAAPDGRAAPDSPKQERCRCCPTSGSHGHSLGLCRLPCRLGADDQCPAGDRCGYCHLPHQRNASPLDRQNREAVASMDDGTRVALLMGAVSEKVEALGLGHVASRLLEAWSEEVSRCRAHGLQAKGKKEQRRLAGALRQLALNVLCRLVKNILKEEAIRDATDRLLDGLRALS